MKIISTLIGLFACQLSFGQGPSLSVQDSGRKQDLGISQMHVNVDVVGNIATTTYDVVFSNPFSRNLEGELSLPLQDGQEICRYALGISGKLREGVIVEKVKARQTFEAIVRKNVDPGIASMTKGNFFKTRIFPIPAHGSKRVVLAFVETLRGDDKNLYYSLPLESQKSIGEFKMDVKVYKSVSKDKEHLPAFGDIKFDTEGDAYCLSLERKNYAATNSLKFTIPRFRRSDHQLFTCQLDGTTYFYLNIKAPELKSAIKKTPEKISIYWDDSFSASNRNMDKELKFLHDYLVSLAGNKEVSLVTFNYRTSSSKVFNIRNDASELIDYIRQLHNDGATCLSSVKFDRASDEILLFSDAVNTVGEDDFENPDVPIYAITSSPGSDYSLLKRIVTETNGEFIDLSVLDMGRALKLIQNEEEKFLSCQYKRSEITEVYPNVPKRVNGYLEVAGILKGEKAKIEVNYGNQRGITKTQSFEIVKGEDAPIARVWATKKIEALEINDQTNQQEIDQLGREFNILTPNTSFIVLDRVEDYVDHHITPPDELKEEYNKLLASREKEKETSQKEVLNNNLDRINKLGAWYNNPPKFLEAGKYANDSTEADDETVVTIEDSESDEQGMIPITREEVANRPPPPPPPPQVVQVLNIVDNNIDITADLAREAIEEKEELNQSVAKSSIKVLAWLPDAPYMKVLRKANSEDIDSLYYMFKDENRMRPSFYIQVADLLFKKKMKEMAIRVLSNTLELDLENPELLKVVARRLMDEGEYAMAIEIFKEIERLRPEEPQSYRDLALAYMANKQYQRALEMYNHILENDWGRFENIKDVVFNELNNLIALHKEELDLDSNNLNYIHPMPLDIRITLDWSSNDNDIDLWVIDPNGEKCFYKHTNTRIGGKISHDFTQGYGPEEFSLKTAKRGIYTVYVNYFSESRQTITGPVTVYVTLFTKYGTDEQETKHLTLQLKEHKETEQVGQLEFEM